MEFCPVCRGKLLDSEGFCSHCGHSLKSVVYLEEHKCISTMKGSECGKKFQSIDVDSIRRISKILNYPDYFFYYCPECLMMSGRPLKVYIEIDSERHDTSRSEKAFLKQCLKVLGKQQ